jgi:CBS domain-containing protein
MLTAGDIMTKDVVMLSPDMTVSDTSELLVRYRIHGAPVVDAAGQLIGMVSLVDLVGRVGDTVRDVMTPDPISAGQDTPVEELAGMMLEQIVRRIPIVEAGRVIGIVSASDIIRVFLSLHEQTPARAEAGRAASSAPQARRRTGRRVVRR